MFKAVQLISIVKFVLDYFILKLRPLKKMKVALSNFNFIACWRRTERVNQ